MANILIVENDQSLLNAYSFKLAQAGHHVSTASKADEALNLFQSQTFNLIVLDLLMPEMSGLDFLKKTNPKQTMPSAKILVLSNAESPNIVGQVMELGASEYALKVEVTPANLVKKVNELLS